MLDEKDQEFIDAPRSLNVNPEVIDVYFDSIDGWQKKLYTKPNLITRMQNKGILLAATKNQEANSHPNGCGDGAFSWRTTKWRANQLP